MPIYEYECKEHGRFEVFSHEYHEGHTEFFCTSCPECGKLSDGVISAWGRVIFAALDTVVGHDGTILSRKQTTEETPMLPEKVHGGRF